MKRFSDLFTAPDQTTKTSARVDALAGYFRKTPEDDRLWTVALLTGRRPKRTVTTTRLREWAAEFAGLPLLFQQCYPVVGDLAETIALILPVPTSESDRGLTAWTDEIRGFADLAEDARKDRVLSAWSELPVTNACPSTT